MPKPEFEWDNENIGHIAKHQIAPCEAEQVVLNRPIDLEAELRNGEERRRDRYRTNSGCGYDNAGQKSSRCHSLAYKQELSALLLVDEGEWQCWKN